jgi:hypothetical protein
MRTLGDVGQVTPIHNDVRPRALTSPIGDLRLLFDFDTSPNEQYGSSAEPSSAPSSASAPFSASFLEPSFLQFWQAIGGYTYAEPPPPSPSVDSALISPAAPWTATPVEVPDCMVSTPAPQALGPSIVCRMVGPDDNICGHPISLRPSDSECWKTNSVREHIHSSHSEVVLAKMCTWLGCKCKRKCEIAGPHPAHVECVAHHVWTSHLNLRWPCRYCGLASWSSPNSFHRHEKDCRDSELQPVRCAVCFVEFSCEADMNEHSYRRACQPTPAVV